MNTHFPNWLCEYVINITRDFLSLSILYSVAAGSLFCFEKQCMADEASVNFLKMINLCWASLATDKHAMMFSNQTHLIFHACHTEAATAAINFDCPSQILITNVEKQKTRQWLVIILGEWVYKATKMWKKYIYFFKNSATVYHGCTLMGPKQ